MGAGLSLTWHGNHVCVCRYHSRIHAADVVHGVFWLVTTAGLANTVQLTSHDIYAMLISAAIHVRARFFCRALPARLSACAVW